MKYLALPLLLALCASAADWTDRKEYDLVLSIRSEASPQKRIGLLDQWKTQYPRSQFQQVRRELYLAAYRAMGDAANTWTISGEMLSAQADSLVGAYWYALLLPEQKSSTPPQLALGEKAANALLTGAKTQTGVELIAHRTLGWVHWQRAEYGPAEEEFRKCLQLDPTAAQVSAWLGTVMTLEQQPEKRVPALWQIARAATYREAGALPDGQRRQFDMLLERLYMSYHGELAGLDQLRTSATAAAFPPDGFDIESAAAAALRKHDEELTRTNPQVAAWVRIRQKLETPEGDKYFSESLHSTALPALKGTLIKAEPADKPTELTIGILDPAKPEIVVKLDAEFPNAADPGTVLEFTGTADSYMKTPFALTVAANRSKITGWPDAPVAPPTKSSAPKSKK